MRRQWRPNCKIYSETLDHINCLGGLEADHVDITGKLLHVSRREVFMSCRGPRDFLLLRSKRTLLTV